MNDFIFLIKRQSLLVLQQSLLILFRNIKFISDVFNFLRSFRIRLDLAFLRLLQLFLTFELNLFEIRHFRFQKINNLPLRVLKSQIKSRLTLSLVIHISSTQNHQIFYHLQVPFFSSHMQSRISIRILYAYVCPIRYQQTIKVISILIDSQDQWSHYRPRIISVRVCSQL